MVMGDDMPCTKGKAHVYELVGDRFLCSQCGHVSPYNPLPSYEELEHQNKLFKKRIGELEKLLGNAPRPAL